MMAAVVKEDQNRARNKTSHARLISVYLSPPYNIDSL